MLFRRRISNPGIESIVDHHPLRQRRVVVVIGRRNTERHGQQSGRFRGQVRPGRIRAANNLGQFMQRRVLDLETIQESIETALLSLMAKIRIRNIKRNGVELNSAPRHPIRIGVENFCSRINKPFDEPGAGQAVDFRAFPRNLTARRLVRFRQVFGFQDRHTTGLHVSVDTTDEFTRVDALCPQTRHRALAHLMPVYAIDDDLGGRWNFFNLSIRLLIVSPVPTADQAVCCIEYLTPSDVEKHRRTRRSNPVHQFLG